MHPHTINDMGVEGAGGELSRAAEPSSGVCTEPECEEAPGAAPLSPARSVCYT